MPTLLAPPRPDIHLPAPPPIDDITRRDLLKGAGALGAGWVLAGCGSDGRQAAGPRPARGTRTVQDAFGEVQVPADPQRVVVLDRRQTLPLLLSLGVVPVAAGTVGFTGGDFAEVLGPVTDEIESFDTLDGIDLERIATFDPDLLIGLATDGDYAFEEIYDEASQIAPTIATPSFDRPGSGPHLRFLGEVVGRVERAEQVLADFDARLDAASRRVGDLGTVTILSAFPDQLRFWSGAATSVGRWVERFGGRVVPELDDLDGEPFEDLSVAVSAERLGEATGDTLVMLQNLGGDAEQQAALDEVRANNPLWNGLPAVETGRVVTLDVQLALGNTGYVGLRAALDELVTSLEQMS